MGKKIFALIVVLMSISLIGIIFVQVYLISNAIENRKQQFNNDVKLALIKTSNILSESEQDFLYSEYQAIFKQKKLADDADIKNYFFQKYDKSGNKVFSLGATILEENFRIPGEFLENDSIIYKRINIKKDYFQSIIKESEGDFFGIKDDQRISFTQRANSLEKQQTAIILSAINRFEPIHKRTSNKKINNILKDELKKRNINLDFKYGVYTNDGLDRKSVV